MSCTIRLTNGDDDYCYLFDGITYNLSPMFREASGHRFADLEGMSGARVGSILRTALHRLVSDPPKYEALNPENGWGDYEGLVKVVTQAAVLAARYPNGTAVFFG